MSKPYSYDPSLVAKLGHRSPTDSYQPLMSVSAAYVAQPDALSPTEQHIAASSAVPSGPPSTKKKYLCNTCGRGFTTSGHLARHTRIHTGERNHACPFPGCETRCSRQDNLQQHYRIHLSPGSRRTTGSASKHFREMNKCKQAAGRSLSGQSTALQSQSIQRSPTLDHARIDSAYSRSVNSPEAVSRLPPPPDTPPPLGCAYTASSRTQDSMSTHSSARSSPALSPYSPSFPPLHSVRTYADVGYSRRTLSGNSDGTSQWEMRSVSGPDSPEYDDMPSPAGSSGYPHSDSDEVSSPSSSATSLHTYSPQDGSQPALSYDYYQSQSGNLVTSTYSSARQANSFVVGTSSRQGQSSHGYQSSAYSTPSPVSPVASQPSSPTYAVSGASGTAYGHALNGDGRQAISVYIPQETTTAQSPYGTNSLSLAGCSPTEAQAARGHLHPLTLPTPTQTVGTQRHVTQLYDHNGSVHPKYVSSMIQVPTTRSPDDAVKSDDGRQSMRRAMSYTSVDALHSHHGAVVHDNRGQSHVDYSNAGDRQQAEELPTQFGQVQPPHSTQGNGAGHASYGYSYSSLAPAHHQAWRADSMRPRATMVH